MTTSTPYQHALLAGALAGTTVDLSLFPLDTLKTRLQSSAGFFPSGGFSGIYRGVGSAVVGSAPGAAFFFVTYEGSKEVLRKRLEGEDGGNKELGAGGEALVHMGAASAGEVAACAVRVPTEVVKQRAQAGLHGGSSAAALRAILSSGSVPLIWRELYRGWGITVFREVPFTIIQFPLWEGLKRWSRTGGSSSTSSSSATLQPGQDVGAIESALYGSMSGGIAAALTTPLDVIKTRVMLSTERVAPWRVFRGILEKEGWRPLFSGLAPRVTWISIGGAIFLGSYQWAVNTMGRVKGEERSS